MAVEQAESFSGESRMFTANQLSANGLPSDKATAIANATAGMTWQQWLQLVLAILNQVGGVIGKLPVGTTPPIP
jgi:hypothetical protein